MDLPQFEDYSFDSLDSLDSQDFPQFEDYSFDSLDSMIINFPFYIFIIYKNYNANFSRNIL